MSNVASVATDLPHLVEFWDVRTRIRDRLNAYPNLWSVIGDHRWQLANGALDAIDDANTAIWTYFGMDWPKGAGEQLLSVYSLFQASVIQQDGVIELRAAAEASTYIKVRRVVDADSPILVKNRELRDQLVGHPANKSWKTDAPSAATSHRNLSNRFRLSASVYEIPNGAFRKEDIDVKSVIEG